MITHLLYLHGFRSSPRSNKAQHMARCVDALRAGGLDLRWACPQLPPSPREAASLVAELTADWPTTTMAVIGSSLGGFYATVLAEARGCRAVVINPVVHAARDLARHIGEQTSFQDPQDRFFFRPEYVEELRDLQPAALAHPERYFALIAQGDEVLDWREMAQRYQGATLKVLEGSDHAVSDFAQHLPEVLGFLGLGCLAKN